MAGPLGETAWGRDGCDVMCERNQTAAHLLWEEVWPDTTCALNGTPLLLITPGALPVIGDVLRYTVSPWLGRIFMLLLKRAMFSPAPIPLRFRADYSGAMALRPSQIRATSVDGALMIPSALSLRRHYDKLPMPVAIMAGKGDKVVFARQARRLQARIPGSTLRIIESVGHMLHHAAPQLVAEAVRQVAGTSIGAAGAATLPLRTIREQPTRVA
jgi:pimeloyl-ACP methyl ester carboxylesterase